MHPISPQECSRIAQDLQIRKVQVESVVQLLDEGNTIPFLACFRKERTGGLTEETLRQVQLRVDSLRQLHERKETIRKSVEHQGKLTDELRDAILSADTLRRLEDLYLPYKPKKRGAAASARERGLEPLALAIWYSDPAVGNLEELLPALVNPEKGLKTPDDVRTGVGQILAEMIAEAADVRAPIRSMLWEAGKINSSKSDKVPENRGVEYKDYFQFSEPARRIPPHRILALNRGEKEGVLRIQFEYPKERLLESAQHALAELLLRRAGQTPPPIAPPPATPSAAPEITPVPAPEAGLEALPPGEVTVEEVSAAPTEPTPPPVPEASLADLPPGSVSVEEVSAATPEPTPPPEAKLADLPPGAVSVEEVSAAPPEPTPAPEASMAELPSSAVSVQEVSAVAPTPPAEPAPLVASMEPRVPCALTGEPLAPGVEFRSPHVAILKTALEDALNRLLLPNLEREIRRELTDEAESHAVAVFARNLRGLLLQPPLRSRRVVAIDPGFRSGCKIVALDEAGNVLEHGVVHALGSSRKGREKSTTAATAPPPSAAQIDVGVTPQLMETTSVIVAAVPMAIAAASSDSVLTGAAGSIMEAPATENPAPAAAAPTPPLDKKAEAKAQLKALVEKHQVQVIALGNGPGCREVEEVLSELIAAELPELSYVLVNESGVSIYSTSQIGREEFPNFDPGMRSVISIGRRLQDPLSELVKVDPQHVGVGLYPHDMGRNQLRESLEAVLESCVNQVGVDVNVANVPLLRHVSGLNQMVARDMVAWRKQHGPFTSREQLLQIAGLGPQRWAQAVGFLKIPDAALPLDRTWIHPESYGLAEKLLAQVGLTSVALCDCAAQSEMRDKLAGLHIDEAARQLGVADNTVRDLIEALCNPGRDPREDLPPPIFKKGILKLEDLQPGMELKGTVLNVVDFGAFVDIGLKDSGLVHISQMANRYIRSPYEVVAVNDVVSVWVMNVDKERHRVSLTMIQPGTDRPPQERRPRREEDGRPPRGRRHGPPPASAPQPQLEAGGHGSAPPGGSDYRGRRPPRGRHGGRGPGRPGHPAPSSEPTPAGAEASHTAPPRRPPLPPRKPRREPPKPKLTQAALEGKVPLRTFSELSALFAAKKEKDVPPPPPVPVESTIPAASSELAEAHATEPAKPVAAPSPAEPQPDAENPPSA